MDKPVRLSDLTPGTLFKFLATGGTPIPLNLTRSQQDAFNAILRVHEVLAGGLVTVSRLEDGSPTVPYWGEMAVRPVGGLRWDDRGWVMPAKRGE